MLPASPRGARFFSNCCSSNLQKRRCGFAHRSWNPRARRAKAANAEAEAAEAEAETADLQDPTTDAAATAFVKPRWTKPPRKCAWRRGRGHGGPYLHGQDLRGEASEAKPHFASTQLNLRRQIQCPSNKKRTRRLLLKPQTLAPPLLMQPKHEPPMPTPPTLAAS